MPYTTSSTAEGPGAGTLGPFGMKIGGTRPGTVETSGSPSRTPFIEGAQVHRHA